MLIYDNLTTKDIDYKHSLLKLIALKVQQYCRLISENLGKKIMEKDEEEKNECEPLFTCMA